MNLRFTPDRAIDLVVKNYSIHIYQLSTPCGHYSNLSILLCGTMICGRKSVGLRLVIFTFSSRFSRFIASSMTFCI